MVLEWRRNQDMSVSWSNQQKRKSKSFEPRAKGACWCVYASSSDTETWAPAVNSYEMPKGVEHNPKFGLGVGLGAVNSYEMPKGVEHEVVADFATTEISNEIPKATDFGFSC